MCFRPARTGDLFLAGNTWIFFFLFFLVRKNVKDHKKVLWKSTLRATDWSKNRERCLSSRGLTQVVASARIARWRYRDRYPDSTLVPSFTSKIVPISAFIFLFVFVSLLFFVFFFLLNFLNKESYSVGETLKKTKKTSIVVLK